MRASTVAPPAWYAKIRGKTAQKPAESGAQTVKFGSIANSHECTIRTIADALDGRKRGSTLAALFTLPPVRQLVEALAKHSQSFQSLPGGSGRGHRAIALGSLAQFGDRSIGQGSPAKPARACRKFLALQYEDGITGRCAQHVQLLVQPRSWDRLAGRILVGRHTKQ